ncbi:hypothetical protein AGLY_009280 [Aphis glycines]|uniref:Uncharacterized protein n=1 Tax=Aphis glycines TaxID=307491 RepID=A0A6G0TK62_APHGL|nr:hypothetical protein AGLY_009280 [Aphis glycines]
MYQGYSLCHRKPPLKFKIEALFLLVMLYTDTKKKETHINNLKNVCILFKKLHLPKLKVSEVIFIEEYCNSNQLTYSKPLSLTIMSTLKKRFIFLYNLTSISHPKFKIDRVPVRYKDLCKKVLNNERNLMYSLVATNSDSADDSDNMSDKEFYSNVCDQSSNNYSPDEEINLQMLNNYPVIKKIFLNYNSTLS